MERRGFFTGLAGSLLGLVGLGQAKGWDRLQLVSTPPDGPYNPSINPVLLNNGSQLSFAESEELRDRIRGIGNGQPPTLDQQLRFYQAAYKSVCDSLQQAWERGEVLDRGFYRWCRLADAPAHGIGIRDKYAWITERPEEWLVAASALRSINDRYYHIDFKDDKERACGDYLAAPNAVRELPLYTTGHMSTQWERGESILYRGRTWTPSGSAVHVRTDQPTPYVLGSASLWTTMVYGSREQAAEALFREMTHGAT